MKIKIKGLVDEDFVNYKLPSMYIIFPSCTFKCDKECGHAVCQNSTLAKQTALEIDTFTIINRYIGNPITHAFVIGGLEPFDSGVDLFSLVRDIREITSSPIVIYTGYTEEELSTTEILKKLIPYKIIIKYGRFIPDQPSHFDEVLGVELASSNQYAKEYK